MTTRRGNKGNWSELYAFYKLLVAGKIFSADESGNRLDHIYFPIIKIRREDVPGEIIDYYPGDDVVAMYKDGNLLGEIAVEEVEEESKSLFRRLLVDTSIREDSFGSFMDRMHIQKISAGSGTKIDMKLKIQDIHTGHSPIVGFSGKSYVSGPPTLWNVGRNTRIRYQVSGLMEQNIGEINSIDKSTVGKDHIKKRIARLFELAEDVQFCEIRDPQFTDNLILIESLMPQIFGEMVLAYFRDRIKNCDDLVGHLISTNPMKYNDNQIYSYKFKKFLCASALGMTAGSKWDGREDANGGYIIVKRNGDVLCYHLHDRDIFEEYLFNSTYFDTPSTSRHDYAYVYNDNGNNYIDFNAQVRFKGIS